MSIVDRALEFATLAHRGQVRKYSGEPYIVHPQEVARILVDHGYGAFPAMIAAAYLHDVVEDCKVPLATIHREFGSVIAQLVEELTDVSKPWEGNRAVRKEIDRAHTAKASFAGKTIKLADLISNTRDIVANDPDFARTYLQEKSALLEVMKDSDPYLYAEANLLVDKSMMTLGLRRKGLTP